jgi:hypothetical protein
MDRVRMVDRTVRQQKAEEDFRRKCVTLKYKMIEMWHCDWIELKKTEGHPVKEFCENFRPTESPFRLDATFKEDQLIDHIRAGRMKGLIQCDVIIPPNRRLECADLPPIFQNRDLTWKDSCEPMRSYAR